MFSPTEIDNILSIIDHHYTMMIYTSLGEQALTDADKLLLESYGVDVNEISQKFPPYEQMFLLGRLVALLKDQNLGQLDFNDFTQYLERGQFIPLSTREREEYRISREKTYGHLKGLANKVVGVTRDIMLEENKKQLISDTISEGVKDRKSVAQIVSELGHKTEEWDRDWKRIVITEMQDIYNQGKASEINNKYGEDALVWKQVFEGACRHCIRLYLTHGLGSAPRVFKLKDLVANGNNIGRKVDEWLPIVGPTHPHCFTDGKTPVYTSKGWRHIEDIKVHDLVLTHKGRYREVSELIFRDVNSFDVKRVFTITVRLNNGKVVRVRKVTSEHPFLKNGQWVKIQNLRISDKISFLHDKCENLDCNEVVPMYYSLLRNNTSSTIYCSRVCANRYTAKIQWENPKNRITVSKLARLQMKKRYESMSFEDKQKLTKNARRVSGQMIVSGTHPFCFAETNIKANKKNGKRCSFIELKLRHFLDKLNVEYKTDFHIEREELKSNGQKRMYFPDIYVPDLNIVIEADGINWHEDKETDNKRDRDIKELIGADTFRFKEDDIRNSGQKVFEELERIVKNHRGEYSFEDVEIVGIQEYNFKTNYKMRLYNFSVEEDESYIVNGLVVHNCRCDLRVKFIGQVWDTIKGAWTYLKDRVHKVERKSKVKVTIGDKEIFV